MRRTSRPRRSMACGSACSACSRPTAGRSRSRLCLCSSRRRSPCCPRCSPSRPSTSGSSHPVARARISASCGRSSA
ncbi:hypothetical protein ACFPRL_07885 [Pseudoclavibacter helvolus]